MSVVLFVKKSNPIVEHPGMLEGLAVRITLPFSDASGIVRAWALKADKLLCYEHVGEETSKPHVHMLLIRVGCHKERLKQLAAPWVPVGSSGNEFWSFKSKTKDLGPVKEETSQKYVIYMTKGQFNPSYNKGFTEDYIELCKSSWMQKMEEDNRDQKLVSMFEEYMYQYIRDDENRDDYCVGGTYQVLFNKGDIVLSCARKWGFALHKAVWNRACGNDSKMVYLTYCMRNNIQIDEKVKLW